MNANAHFGITVLFIMALSALVTFAMFTYPLAVPLVLPVGVIFIAWYAERYVR